MRRKVSNFNTFHGYNIEIHPAAAVQSLPTSLLHDIFNLAGRKGWMGINMAQTEYKGAEKERGETRWWDEERERADDDDERLVCFSSRNPGRIHTHDDEYIAFSSSPNLLAPSEWAAQKSYSPQGTWGEYNNAGFQHCWDSQPLYLLHNAAPDYQALVAPHNNMHHNDCLKINIRLAFSIRGFIFSNLLILYRWRGAGKAETESALRHN